MKITFLCSQLIWSKLLILQKVGFEGQISSQELEE